eukprot:4594851-Prymnesium_polylepis.5
MASQVDSLGLGNAVMDWRARSVCERREHQLRSDCRLPLSCHWLCATKAESVEKMLCDVVDTVAARYAYAHNETSVAPPSPATPRCEAGSGDEAGSRGASRRLEARVQPSEPLQEWVC